MWVSYCLVLACKSPDTVAVRSMALRLFILLSSHTSFSYNDDMQRASIWKDEQYRLFQKCTCCIQVFMDYLVPLVGRGSSITIATRYGAGLSENRIPMGAKFSALVQTGPEAHAASYTMGTRSFPGVNWPGHGVNHSLNLVPRLIRVELCLSSPSELSSPVLV